MAIQNFLSGGFYGKLGNVVGQRWHNKRILREYVIGANPRTPKQQANRELFATATRLAQDAMNINKGHESWDTTSVGEFSQRVGTAKRRLQNGASEADALPLYPDSYIPSADIEGGSIDWSMWTNRITLNTTAPRMTEARQFGLILHCKSWLDDLWRDFPFTTTVPLNSLLYYELFTQNGYCYPSGAYVAGATSDDSTHNNTTIRLPPVSITQPTPPTVSVTASFSAPVFDTGNTWVIKANLSKETLHYEELDVRINARNISTGSWNILNATLTLNNEGENTIYIDVGDEFTFPSGSYIYADTVNVDYTDFKINYEWYRFDFSI